jgi:hypothetical protein
MKTKVFLFAGLLMGSISSLVIFSLITGCGDSAAPFYEKVSGTIGTEGGSLKVTDPPVTYLRRRDKYALRYTYSTQATIEKITDNIPSFVTPSAQWQAVPSGLFSVDPVYNRIYVRTSHLSDWRWFMARLEEGTSPSPKVYTYKTLDYPSNRYPANLPDSEIDSAIDQAIALWDEILPNINFQRITDPSCNIEFDWDPDLLFTLRPDVVAYNWAFDRSVHFNNNLSWEFGDSSSGAYDIKSVCMHEFGHLLGITGDLYRLYKPVMNSGILPSETFSTLGNLDIYLLSKLYEVSVDVPTPAPLAISTSEVYAYVQSANRVWYAPLKQPVVSCLISGS